MSKKSTIAKSVSANPILVETKLTRSEVIDFLVHELQEEVRKEYNEVSTQIAALKMPREAFLPFLQEIKASNINLYSSSYRTPDESGVSLSAAIQIPRDRLPQEYLDYLATHQALLARQQELGSQLDKLQHNKGVVKNEIIRRTLSETEEGKAALQNLQDLKVSLKAKLLPDK